jgi:MFS transporter, ACS family, hexuronate transporter
MSFPPGAGPPAGRSHAWKWWVCGLLLLATMLNYMDRLTLNLTAVRLLQEFRLDERDYGQLESAFAFAFALGAIVIGWMADRWSVRWIYPAAVFAWSLAGLATGLAGGFVGLLLCRFLLGLSEAGNWPCALRTTQHILPPAQRTLGNSILQSGAALGAILTPLVVLALVNRADANPSPEWVAGTVATALGQGLTGVTPGVAAVPWLLTRQPPGSWRGPFVVIGLFGLTWVALWFLSVRRGELVTARGRRSPSLVSVLGWLVLLLGLDTAVRAATSNRASLPAGLQPLFAGPWLPLGVKVAVCLLGIAGVSWWLLRVTADEPALPRRLFLRRFLALIVMVVAINVAWHYFRAWLPLFLQKQHNYTETATGWFILAYYVATDLGSLSAGFTTLGLTRWGTAVHRSRVLVFVVCALGTTLSVAAAFLPTGPLLLGVLLLIGFYALGLFPNYYSFSQELTVRHQGKLTGSLGCICWLAMYLLHELAGESIKQTGSFSQGVALAGLAPLVGVAALLLLWGKTPRQEPAAGAADKTPAADGLAAPVAVETQKGSV